MTTIVLDAGGTLIHPARPVGETYAHFARHWQVSLDPEATTRAFYAAFKNMGPRTPGTIPRDGHDHAWWREMVARALADHDFIRTPEFDDYFAEVYQYYAQPEAWCVYPEVREVLEDLQTRGHSLVLLSNWDARLHPVLEGHGLGGFFAYRFISAELGWEKPDSAIYEYVSKVVLREPHQLLSVGDDEENDFIAPQRAGWQALLLNRPEVDLRVLLK